MSNSTSVGPISPTILEPITKVGIPALKEFIPRERYVVAPESERTTAEPSIAFVDRNFRRLFLGEGSEEPPTAGTQVLVSRLRVWSPDPPVVEEQRRNGKMTISLGQLHWLVSGQGQGQPGRLHTYCGRSNIAHIIGVEDWAIYFYWFFLNKGWNFIARLSADPCAVGPYGWFPGSRVVSA